MSDGEKRAQPRYPAALRVKVKYPDVNTFIQKYASNISEGGVFIASKNVAAVGTLLRFEFLLAAGESDTSVISGLGEVRWIRTESGKGPGEQAGMGISFLDLDGDSEEVIRRAIAYRAEKSDAEAEPGTTPPSAAASATSAPRPNSPDAKDSARTSPPAATAPVQAASEAAAPKPAAAAKSAATPAPIKLKKMAPSSPEDPAARSLAEQDLKVIARESGLTDDAINDVLRRYSSRPIDFASLERLTSSDASPPLSKEEAFAKLRDLLDDKGSK